MSILIIPISDMIGLTILHSLWQITFLWIVLITVLRLWPRASSAVRYALAVSTLLLSVLTTAATAIYEWQSYTASAEVSGLSHDTAFTPNITSISMNKNALPKIVDSLDAFVPILAWFWCAGLIVMGARFGGSLFYLRKLQAPRNISAVQAHWKRSLQHLSKTLRLKCNVTIATSERISSPLTLGCLSPIILLPAGLLSALSTAQIEAILVHELYHIKRHDYIVNIGQALVEVLLFYHPAIWHINTIVREEREICCDDQTVAYCGDAMMYARTLTRIQEFNILPKPALTMSATGSHSGNFSNRIKRLFHMWPNPGQAQSKGIVAAGFLLVYLCMVLVGANISTATPVEPERKSSNPPVDEHSTHDLSSDSISANKHINVHSEKKITPKYALPAPATDMPPADTLSTERSLDKCLKQVRELLSLASVYGFSADSLEFLEFDTVDSLEMSGPGKLFPKTTRTFQSIRLDGIGSRSKSKNSLLIDTTGNDTKQEFFKFNVPETTPLYIIDGKRIDGAQNQLVLENLQRASALIQSISINKNQQVIELYGDEGKNGVIDIRLKPETSIDEFLKILSEKVFPTSINGELSGQPGSQER